jgi:hypothetical protein
MEAVIEHRRRRIAGQAEIVEAWPFQPEMNVLSESARGTERIGPRVARVT